MFGWCQCLMKQTFIFFTLIFFFPDGRLVVLQAIWTEVQNQLVFCQAER